VIDHARSFASSQGGANGRVDAKSVNRLSEARAGVPHSSYTEFLSKGSQSVKPANNQIGRFTKPTARHKKLNHLSQAPSPCSVGLRWGSAIRRNTTSTVLAVGPPRSQFLKLSKSPRTNWTRDDNDGAVPSPAHSSTERRQMREHGCRKFIQKALSER